MAISAHDYCWCACFTVLVVLYLSHETQAQWLLQSQNAPTLKISFDPGNARFLARLDDRGRRFYLRQPGLTGQSNSVSFESIDYPGRYLRHYGYIIYAEFSDGTELYNMDATFTIHTNRHMQNYYSFESSNYKTYYLRHRNEELLISNDTNEYWEGDVSFRFTQQNIMLQPRSQSGCEVSHCKVLKGNGDQLYVEDKGQLFNMVSPALNGQRLSVSFEDALRTGYYLRDYGQYAFVDAANSTRSPYTFTQDASFYLKFNQFSSGFYGIESSKYPGRYLRAVEKNVKISPQDGSNNYGTEASFQIVEGPVYLESQNMVGYKIGLNEKDEAVMTQEGARWNVIYPGLTGHRATLSLESFDKPGYFLRHFGYLLDLEDRNDPRNPGLIDQDASFIVRKDVFFQDFIIMESVNYRNHSIRHSDNRLSIVMYEGSEQYTQDVSFKIVAAPLFIDPGGNGGSGANVGAIVGGICGLLLLVLLIVGAVFLDKRLAWTDTVKHKFQNESADTRGGLDNPVYPAIGIDVEQPRSTPREASSRLDSVSSVGSSAPTTPTTPSADPFTDSGTVQTTNPVRKLGRRLSDSVNRLRRTSSTKSNEDRRMDMPQSFDLSMQDFQPGYDSQESKGSFDNPMYGLNRLSQGGSTDDESGYVSPLNRSKSLQRHDSLIEASPVLTATPTEFDQAMSFYDQAIEEASSEDLDLGDIGSKKEEIKEKVATDDPIYATIDKSKKKISAGITPITEDDLWDITDA